MRFQKRRHIAGHDRDRVVLADAVAIERAGKTAAACISLGPAAALGAMDHRETIGMHRGSALDKAQRR